VWQKDIAVHCTDFDFQMNLKQACKLCRELEQGLIRHVPKEVSMKLMMPDGSISTTDAQNTDVLEAHYKQVFERSDVPINITVVDGLGPL
jgi:hypothetical protein